MQDIDFDELDRAVNSVHKPANAEPIVAPEPVVDTPAPVSAEPAVEVPSAPVTPELKPTFAPVTRRNSGRFMDMVHASSDMRPAAAERSPLARPVEVAPAPVIETPVETEAKETHSWPDPIDFAHGQAEESQSIESLVDLDEELAPQDSPFLPGAKVEKRPLGGDGSIHEEARLLFEEPDELLLEAPEPIERIEALSSDTESIEELNTAPAVEAVEAVAQFEAIAESEPDLKSEEVTEETFSGPVSIQQQYADKPSTADAPGAIYDTESYHQPLAHPVKKKSGLWIVLWIFLLVIFGAGAGAAVYFFVLPML